MYNYNHCGIKIICKHKISNDRQNWNILVPRSLNLGLKTINGSSHNRLLQCHIGKVRFQGINRRICGWTSAVLSIGQRPGIVRSLHEFGQRPGIVRALHDFGHFGRQRTANLIPERSIRGVCMIMLPDAWERLQCQLRDLKLERDPELNSIPVKDKAFDKIGVELFGPVLESSRGHKYLAVAVDYLSKYAEIRSIRDKSSRTVACFIEMDVIARNGCPRAVSKFGIGTELKGEFTESLEEYSIHHHLTNIARPRENGLTKQHNTFWLKLRP